MPHTTQSSFTLLELLIVIAIIAILAATVMVSLSSTRQSAWEARGMQFSQNIKTTLADSLVGEWSFDDQSNPGRDDSGNGNNGTIYKSSAGGTCTGYPNPQSGCPQLVNGKVRGALSFDGVDDYLGISSINPTNEITVEAWVRSKNSTGYSSVWQIVSKYNAYILGTGSSGGRNMNFIIYCSSGWTYGTYYNVPDPQNWHHFVGTYDSATKTKKLYVDGVLKISNTDNNWGPINLDTGPINIAQRECCPGQVFNGTIDEVRIYNRALTAYEIKALYAEGKMRHLADR